MPARFFSRGARVARAEANQAEGHTDSERANTRDDAEAKAARSARLRETNAAREKSLLDRIRGRGE